MPLVSKAFGDIITFTRASTATYFDSAGVLQSAAINAPRLDYNPSTLAAQGLLIEEARTNSIRNNTGVGAVAGTPGTVPTNWNVTAPGGGITREIVGTGTENGITYIDIRAFGTTTAPLFYAIRPEQLTQIAALNTQTWTSTFYVRLTAGSLTNITQLNHVIQFNDVAGAPLTFGTGGITPTGAALSTQRFTRTTTAANASTAFVQNLLQIEAPTATAIDITLRIGLPQLELGAFATSVIPTSTVAVTRSADVASVNTLSPWYNATEGTLYAEGLSFAPTSSFARVTAIEDAAFNPVISIQRNATDARGFGDGASTIISAGMLQNTIFKVALAAKVNDFALSANGSVPNADTATNPLPTAVKMGIGQTTAGTSPINGYLRRITYYPRRLTNAELQTITA